VATCIGDSQADLAYMGGKLDDITVVVARVADAQEVRVSMKHKLQSQSLLLPVAPA